MGKLIVLAICGGAFVTATYLSLYAVGRSGPPLAASAQVIQDRGTAANSPSVRTGSTRTGGGGVFFGGGGVK